jgi:phosphodiesterase/alkaline phosphatase D-like protein
MPLYRRLRFGDLAEINLLDTRQYRDDLLIHRSRCPLGGCCG